MRHSAGAAKDKPHVGAPKDPSLEAIVAMHPDLVLATTSINRPTDGGCAVEVGNSGVHHATRTRCSGCWIPPRQIAGLLGAEEQGAKLVADLQKRLDALHALLQDRPMVHVLFVVWEEPLISIGQNTFIADALRWAGAESVITSDQNWPQVSMEEVVRLQPDYIVLTPDHMKAEGTRTGERSEQSSRVARFAGGETGARRGGERRNGQAFAGIDPSHRAAGARFASGSVRRERAGKWKSENGNLALASNITTFRTVGGSSGFRPAPTTADGAGLFEWRLRREQRRFARAPADAETHSGNLRGARVLLFIEVVISLRMGDYPIGVRDIVATLYHGALGQWDAIPSEFKLVVFGLRLPRIALGILVGAALSTAGAGFQALLRNPLADPYVLGVSSGAALGAMLSLIVAPHTVGAIQIAAFVGAAATIAAVYFLGRRGGQLDSATLLLAGIVAASFLSAIIIFLLTMVSGTELRSMTFWLMGDLTAPPPTTNVVGWFGFLFLIFVVAAGAMYTTSSDLNLILTGEQEARHLGVNVNRVKMVVYIAASVLTGLAVSVSGAIGYIGLLVPHVMRLLFGTDYRLLLPTSAIGGAIVIVLADTLARTVVAPTQLPVGAMTALAGAPVFIYLMRKRMR